MINRQNVSALINEVVGNLNTYLQRYPHYMLNREQASKGYDIKSGKYDSKDRFIVSYTHHYNYFYIHYKDDLYIGFANRFDYRNTDLTLNRMKNIYTIRDTLNNFLESLKAKHDEKTLTQLINQIRDQLIKGQEENTKLSSTYGYVHRSYSENQLLGLGIFSSWWHKTWCQSQANVALEKSLSTLDKFSKKFIPQQEAGKNQINDDRPPAYAPSAPLI